MPGVRGSPLHPSQTDKAPPSPHLGRVTWRQLFRHKCLFHRETLPRRVPPQKAAQQCPCPPARAPLLSMPPCPPHSLLGDTHMGPASRSSREGRAICVWGETGPSRSCSDVCHVGPPCSPFSMFRNERMVEPPWGPGCSCSASPRPGDSSKCLVHAEGAGLGSADCGIEGVVWFHQRDFWELGQQVHMALLHGSVTSQAGRSGPPLTLASAAICLQAPGLPSRAGEHTGPRPPSGARTHSCRVRVPAWCPWFSAPTWPGVLGAPALSWVGALRSGKQKLQVSTGSGDALVAGPASVVRSAGAR